MSLLNNLSHITGNITKDANIRQNRNGSYSAFFTVAINDYGSRQKDGSRKQYTNFIPVRNYLTTMPQVNFYRKLTKGKKISVVGSLVSNNYTDKNNVRHYRLYITPTFNGIGFENPRPNNQNGVQNNNIQVTRKQQPVNNTANNQRPAQNQQPVNNLANNQRPAQNQQPVNNTANNQRPAQNQQPVNNTANNQQAANQNNNSNPQISVNDDDLPF